MEGASTYFPSRDNFQSGGGRRHNRGNRRKRLRILVVHDFDLKSSAKLAESSLLSSNNIRSQRTRSEDPLLEKCVDLCIAVNTTSKSSTPDGLYDPDDELLPYYQGQQKRNRMLKTRSNFRPLSSPYSYTYNGTEVGHLRGRPRIGKKTLSSSFRSIPIPVPLPPASQPVFHNERNNHNNNSYDESNGNLEEPVDVGDGIDNPQFDPSPSSRDSLTTTITTTYHKISPEERAARRGLVTAALSQLESIVCRVAYVLKDNRDDDEKGFDSYSHLRLTSNSLDVRNRWLPLVEGLGLAGLVERPKRLFPLASQSSSSDMSSSDSDSDGNSECESHDDEDENPSVVPAENEPEGLHPSSRSAVVVSPCGENGNAQADAKQNKDGNPKNYFELLEGLLRSAHPLRIPGRERGGYTNHDEGRFPRRDDLMGPLFQSIVVATAPAPRSDNGTVGGVKSETSPEEDELPNDAWNSFVQDHLLLEIVAGSEGPPNSFSSSSQRNATVVVPGSLRQKGEFCLVDLVLEDESSSGGEESSIDMDSGNPHRPNRWRVEKTHFHRLESEKNTREWA